MKPSIIEQKGFTWVALPREGVEPFILLEKVSNGVFQRIKNAVLEILGMPLSVSTLNADVFSLFPKPKGRGQKPELSPPKEVAFFKGHDILDAEAGIDFKSFEDLEIIGSAEAKVNLQKARKLLYNFKEPQQVSVNSEVILEGHLNRNKPNTKAVGFLEKLRSGNLYVATDVLQTTSFHIQDASDFSIEGDIDLQAVESYIAQLKAVGKYDSQNKDKVGYKGETPVTFALKASKILYNNNTGHYSIRYTPLKDVRSLEDVEEKEENRLEEKVISID